MTPATRQPSSTRTAPSVHLMTQLLKIEPGDSVTTPPVAPAACCCPPCTSSAANTRSGAPSGSSARSATSPPAIARMNLFLHGIEDFEIDGDTLASPPSLQGDKLRQFDVCLANPPYSDQAVGPEARGRPTSGGATCTARRPRAAPTTPSGSTSSPASIRAPAAAPSSSRTASSFRDEEHAMRRKIVDCHVVDADDRSGTEPLLTLMKPVSWYADQEAQAPQGQGPICRRSQ